eukprot:g5045.t1
MTCLSVFHIAGFNNWNQWANHINASIFRETAQFMKDKGFLAAGYEYVTLGGIGYANGSTPGGNITRNASGYLVVDPLKFPGGNPGFVELTNDIRALGFRFGAYTEAGTAGCNGAKGSSEGFETKDAALFVDDWKSEYLMIDSCGIQARDPPNGPPPGYPGGQARWEMSKWKDILKAKQAGGHKAVLLHDCHNGCTSTFAGPTLVAVKCDNADPHQHWLTSGGGTAGLPAAGKPTLLMDRARGLCAGCAGQPVGGCGGGADGDKATHGLGMQACITQCAGEKADTSSSSSSAFASAAAGGGSLPSLPRRKNPAACIGTGEPRGLGQQQQTFNYTSAEGTLRNAQGGICLGLRNGTGPEVVGGEGGHPGGNATSWPPACPAKSDQWDAMPVHTGDDDSGFIGGDIGDKGSERGERGERGDNNDGHLLADAYTMFRSRADPGLCLSSAGAPVPANIDPWCIENNNMWRSSTDVLQVWTRVMIEVESMATQGSLSRPGAWSFPDCLEVGVPGYSTLTWQEAQSNVALFAVSSAPLFLGNDARHGRMQDRLVDLLLNKDMLAVNAQYHQGHGFAGGRIWSTAPGQEVWAKPLVDPEHGVAVVVFNRDGTAVGETPPGNSPLPPFCSNPDSPNGPCTGCFGMVA